MVYTLFIFSFSKCSLFDNSNIFGSCIIHILYTGCAKIKKNNSGAKRLISTNTWLHFLAPTQHCFSLTCLLWPPLGVLALYSLFLYLDPPPPFPSPSDWVRLFSSQTIFCINTPAIPTSYFSYLHCLWRWNR